MKWKPLFTALLLGILGAVPPAQAQSYQHIAPHTVGGMSRLNGATFRGFASVGLTAAGSVENAARTRVAEFGPWPIYLLKQRDDTGSLVEQADVPSFFQLDQNYPNPFNPQTTIRYALPQASQVRLAVYDVLGREVALLVDRLQAAGAHETNFEATDFPSGVYLYRLEAGGFVDARTMLLAK
ncbi:MAG TPA: T9SS type A sorting domain-containing protein [Rhodothermales bacterium]|nr:T9SS type A sorting domain-containing protein [Rhodothermales bacterium]